VKIRDPWHFLFIKLKGARRHFGGGANVTAGSMPFTSVALGHEVTVLQLGDKEIFLTTGDFEELFQVRCFLHLLVGAARRPVRRWFTGLNGSVIRAMRTLTKGSLPLSHYMASARDSWANEVRVTGMNHGVNLERSVGLPVVKSLRHATIFAPPAASSRGDQQIHGSIYSTR